jgi:hypothetical protein
VSAKKERVPCSRYLLILAHLAGVNVIPFHLERNSKHCMNKLWDSLHDCGIVECLGIVPGDIRFKVALGHLSKYLSLGQKSLWVTLKNCSFFKYEVSPKKTITLPGEICKELPVILGGRRSLETKEIKIACVGGMLFAKCEQLELSLPDGVVVLPVQVEEAAKRYWQGNKYWWSLFWLVVIIVIIALHFLR